MGTVRASINVSTVEDGSTYNGYLMCIVGVPFQFYKEGSPVASWTVQANQPVITPVIIAGGVEVQNTLTNISWMWDSPTGTPLVDGVDYTLTAPSGGNGPKLTIKSDILSALKASRMLYFQGTANIDGVATVVRAWMSIEYKEASGDISELVLSVTDKGVCKNAAGAVPAVEGIVLTPTVYKGGVLASGYSFAFYAYNPNDNDADNTDDWQDLSHANASAAGYPGVVFGPAAAASPMPILTAGQVWIPKKSIASSEKIKCVGTKAGSPTVTNYVTLYDLSDPIQIEFTTTAGRTNINAKNPALDITAAAKQLTTSVTPASDFVWTVQGSDGQPVTNAQSGTKKAVLSLAYANTKGRGNILITCEATF